MKFYRCEHCGNIIDFMEDAGVPISCCGEKMQEIIPGTTDAAVEKHKPVIQRDGAKITVMVGEVPHPMEESHYITWDEMETKKGVQKAWLKPGEAPKAEFVLADGDELIAVYAYCNLHGLWKADPE